MLVAIDLGNTNTGFAVYDGDHMVAHWRCVTVTARTSDEYAAFLFPLLAQKSLQSQDFKAMIVSSVVPGADRALKVFGREHLKVEPCFVTRESIDLSVRTDRPEEVGADRLVNAVAVRAFHKIPAVVIDFGTATTFDVVGSDGAYEGGVIAPGIQLSVEALRQAAAKLPKVEVSAPEKVIGTSTRGAIQSGVFWGYVSLIEGLLQRIEKEMGQKPYVIATGGLAPLFAPHTPVIEIVDESLILRGLHLIYKRMNKDQ